jgi:hypothetical protein
LLSANAIKVSPGAETGLGRDDLIEIEGQTRITAASLAGKMFFILRRLMDTADGDLDTIFDLDVNDLPVAEQLKQVYFRNELLPIPTLLELTGSQLPRKVYVNVRPDHFIDAASANKVEGDPAALHASTPAGLRRPLLMTRRGASFRRVSARIQSTHIADERAPCAVN